jgi:predicted regulator of Ras-like GTPase activity (Roadblock/LC7/MglB family)
MAIPFLNLVRKAKEKFEARKRPSVVKPLPSVQDKPEADKLAKRVTPYAVRTMTPEPTAPALAAASTMGGRRISLNRPGPGSPPDLGPSGVVSVEPRGERTVSLALGDVLAAMPQGYVKPNESFDTTRRVTLKAVEVERGLATGRPSIPIATLYQQVPEIFEHTVVPSDATVVVLPVQKVIDELSQLRVREDQTADAISAQVETPFLKLMVEESAKFGTAVTPFETTELILPVEPVAQTGLVTETARVEPVRPPASAPPPPTIARPPFTPAVAKQPAAPPPVPPVQPAPAARIPLTPPPSISLPQTGVEPNRDGSTPRVPLVTPTAQPDKNKPLSFGTGGSAFPRVPASSGPPVPSTSTPTAAPPLVTPPVASPTSGPTRIPFQSPDDAPARGGAEQPRPVPLSPARVPLSVSGPVAATPSQRGGQQMVTLPLRPILQSLPPMQVAGDVESVPMDAKISFQISAIAPQLASGKVVIPPKEFHGALPEQYRGLFLPEAVEAPVQLSLPDVLANLPGDSLRMRDDQEVFAQDEIFETPFLAKAKEDAERFAQSPEVTHAHQPVAQALKVETPRVELPSEVIAKAPEATTPAVPKIEPPPKVQAPRIQAPAPVDRLGISIVPAAASPAALAKIAPEAPKFDAKAAITQACALAGVSACSVTFADGLIIAGNIPDDMHMEGLSAVAPTMLKKLEKHMCETQLGPLTCITVHGEKSPVTFFSAGNLCLTAVHNGCELSAESRRELSRITQELSRTYPQLETAHVNH